MNELSDTIYRQAAIKALKALAVPRYKDPACEDMWERDRTLDNAIAVMRDLPSAQPDLARDIATIIENEKDMRVILKNAQPERKKGKWLKKKGSLWTLATCSVCGELSVEGNKPFCSNCGSYNGGEDERR